MPARLESAGGYCSGVVEIAAPVPPDSPPPFWTVQKVIAGLLVFLFFGFAVGMFVHRPQPPERPFNDADVGFLQDMLTHHEQAVEMAAVITAPGSGASAPVRQFANEVVVLQRREIGVMETLLDVWGVERGEGLSAMGWMGMPGPVTAMPGYQTAASMTGLSSASGLERDGMFLNMMREHHAGGVQMSAAVQRFGKEGRVFELAARMAANQASEIGEYERLMGDLGIAYAPLAGRPGSGEPSSDGGPSSAPPTSHDMAGMISS